MNFARLLRSKGSKGAIGVVGIGVGVCIGSQLPKGQPGTNNINVYTHGENVESRKRI